MVEPILIIGRELPWIVFGDGMFAEELDSWFIVDNEGIKKRVIQMRPDDNLMYKFNIQDRDLDFTNRAIVREYPDELVTVLSEGRMGVILIDCDFNGYPTKLIEKHQRLLDLLRFKTERNKDLTFQVRILEERIKRMTNEKRKEVIK